jgi:aminoglycoside phosphotransferase family enzyme/predicted kinase
MTAPAAAQAQTVALLRGLAGGRAPVETHISLVFLGDDTVWKLRKAVRLPFLDFTTPAERHRAALREFELNAPHAPSLYRDVVPVTRGGDGRLAIGGDGEAIDWVVRMARVPAGDFLDVVAARGGLDGAMPDALGDAVAAWLAAATPQALDGCEAQRWMTDGNVRSARAAGLPAAEIATWQAAMQRELTRRADWLRARAAAGFVRRCHGDLHLGNICLWRGAPVPFDAVEFDEAIATGDVAYDLAFLLMDLEHKAGRAAADRVLNRYVARTGDWALVAGLPLFLAQKAMVRAHVEAARRHADEAGAYLAMSLGYLQPAPPIVVAIGGLQGSGKSTLARMLAPDLGAAPGALVLRSDELRKRRHGVAPEQRLPEAAYSPAEHRAVAAELQRAASEIVAAGHAVVADTMFLDPAARRGIEAAASGVRFLGVWLQAPLDVLEARIAARAGDASDATVEVLRRTAAADPGPMAWLRVDASDLDAALGRVRDAVRCADSGRAC